MAEALRLLLLTKYHWLLAATVLGALKSWLTGLRWRHLAPASHPLSTTKSFHFYGIGVMINMTLPFRVGDLVRARLIAEALKIPGTQALGTIASEHILDFTMLCCLLITCFTLYSYHWPTQVIPTVSVFFALALSFFTAVFILRTKKNTPLIQQWKTQLSAVLPKRLLIFPTMLRNFYSGLFHFGDLMNVLKILGSTASIWLAQSLWIYALLSSLGIAESYHLGFEAPLVLVVMMGIAVMIPSSPGYIGTFHLITLLGLTQMGVPKSVALSFAILAHAHAVAVAISVGLYSLWKGSIKLSFNLKLINKPAALPEIP